MAESRPYRIARQQPALTRVKLIALASFAIGAFVINQHTTNTAAHMFGLRSYYLPWQWLVWWQAWHAAPAFQPVWSACTRLVFIPTLVLAGIAVAAIIIARNLLGATAADLHGSAR